VGKALRRRCTGHPAGARRHASRTASRAVCGPALAILAAAALGAASGCAGVQPRTDWDRTVDFQQYDSFAVLAPRTDADGEALADPQGDPFASPLLLQRARRMAAKILQDAGYLESPRERADLWVVARVATREKVEVRGSYYPHVTWTHGWTFRGGPIARTYTEGTLILDLIDAGSRELVWRGWASEPVSEVGPGPEKVRRFVEAILARFPPAPDDTAS